MVDKPENNNSKPSDDRPKGEVLVRAENIGKVFCSDLRRSLAYGVVDGIGDLFSPLSRGRNPDGSPKLRKKEFWANKDISFVLRRGECLGLIGHNGAGKTTLLKMLNGLIKPDTGRIEICGRVGALIALNAGFNPILTGRENIYIVGSVYGLTKKEIDAKFDEIVDFAQVGEFIDTPVQNYSSGMQVRLGFSVASSLEPDVLIIDEVLAVGDAEFKVKCINKISQLLEKCAVIFVSHNELQVKRLVTQAMFLEHGVVKAASEDVNEVFIEYHRANKKGGKSKIISDGVEFSEIVQQSLATPKIIELNKGHPFVYETKIHLLEEISNSEICLIFMNQSGDAVYSIEHSLEGEVNKEYTVRMEKNCVPLNTGLYNMNLLIYDKSKRKVLLRATDVATVAMKNESVTQSILIESCSFSMNEMV